MRTLRTAAVMRRSSARTVDGTSPTPPTSRTELSSTSTNPMGGSAEHCTGWLVSADTLVTPGHHTMAIKAGTSTSSTAPVQTGLSVPTEPPRRQ